MTAPAVSIIVCAFSDERLDLMIRAVESLLSQPEQHEIVLVIDNNAALLERARIPQRKNVPGLRERVSRALAILREQQK